MPATSSIIGVASCFNNTIVIREIETNRPWMTEALKLAMVKTGNRFALPGGLKGKMIRVLL